ncbi:histidinol-phosphate aminotransferase [Buchnera aphidicola (Schlechtendalia chinensis)]|uniref:Histidinol-phosphate aminotransferase n=2 Tax=Buchnera aphidicola subsp. Schlechtendalia chinensis TaxID=118110 RepID=HIS8_BUCSC|nr:histidinol-phosphate transaminase [Buchnera aphidicola]Q84I51.1 RecName: Full=Histidinol-phosphate aminotransferase; AltName: Full=Imidazole acetol-phosphate transaminase [Buchnera aphidicola (Schlechtendalia chinensis)]AAO33047.1 histidinolphosphate aminotransferase [Buchnera aphidicola]ANF16909.1 histidinol-phosphate aminotransferase [Buchnera aphidicola (Schlechtendalia chinensis)]
MNIKQLVRKNIQELQPYQSARTIGGKGDIWLNANECPTFNRLKLENIFLNRYPECQPRELLLRYSSYIGLDKKNILITRGSDEAIELLIKTFCEPQCDRIVFCPPTYDMYNVSANIMGVECLQIPLLNHSWQLDLKVIKKCINNFKLIYLCNPNNPTGSLINFRDVLALLKMTYGKSLVIIDEAYIEFSPMNSLVNLISQYSNLVVLRTLSKAFSLAGLRCGFVLANFSVIKFLLKVINPYPISTPTSSIAIQFLSNINISKMQDRVFSLILNRCWLINELKLISNCIDHIFYSASNYVLVRFRNSNKVFHELSNQGIIVRDQSKKINLKNCIRISIGTSQECLKVIHAIRKIDCLYVN